MGKRKRSGCREWKEKDRVGNGKERWWRRSLKQKFTTTPLPFAVSTGAVSKMGVCRCNGVSPRRVVI